MLGTMTVWDAFVGIICCFFSSCLRSIDFNSANHWAWFPSSSSNRISWSIYNHLNRLSISDDSWSGWDKLWKLHVAPRVRHFLLLTLLGRISTCDYLFSFNLGTRSSCILCSTDNETAEHLYLLCNKAQLIWHQIGIMIGKNLSLSDGFCYETWLTDLNHSMFIISIIAAITWLFGRPDATLILSILPRIIISSLVEPSLMRENFPRQIRSSLENVSSQFLWAFLVLLWSLESCKKGRWSWFFLVKLLLLHLFCRLLLLHSRGYHFCRALIVTIRASVDNFNHVQHIFIDNQDSSSHISSAVSPFDWRLTSSLADLRQLLVTAGNPTIHVIPHAWITPATKLDAHGANLHALSLFLLCRELPF